MTKIAAVVGIGGAGMLYMLWRFQESLLYHPKVNPQMVKPSQNPESMRHPMEHNMPYESVYLTTPDGERLHAWLIHPSAHGHGATVTVVDSDDDGGSGDANSHSRKRPTVLFFHANAGNMGMRLQNIKLLYDACDVNVLIVSYRGYGESSGEPNEKGLEIDAEATFQYALSRSDVVDADNLFVFGRSLGGAVAVSLACRTGGAIRGLVLENTFTCIGAMMDKLFPVLRPVKRWLLRMDWPSLQRIGDVETPVLFISGLQDELIPPGQMLALYTAAVAARTRRLLKLPGTHNDTWRQGGEAYVIAIRDFIIANRKGHMSGDKAARL
jgi:pimeloyl-ACP methyl ester carboxylesterase